MFDWDANNLRKIRAHRIKAEEVEKALSNDPIPIYEQDVEGEARYVFITARQIPDGCWPWYWLSAAKRSESLLRTTWMPGRRRITSPGACEGSEDDEKETDRHAQVRQRSTGGGLVGQPRRPRVRKAEGGRNREERRRTEGSRLVGQLNKVASVQIALRLPEPDVAKARELATRKGIGYQTLLKMLVHEGLRREARRA